MYIYICVCVAMFFGKYCQIDRNVFTYLNIDLGIFIYIYIHTYRLKAARKIKSERGRAARELN